MNATQLYRHTMSHGGATVRQGRYITSGGYVVGAGNIATIDVSRTDDIMTILRQSLKNVHSLGTWIDGNTLYVDAVAIVQDANRALSLARRRGELAIYSLDTQEEIRVS